MSNETVKFTVPSDVKSLIKEASHIRNMTVSSFVSSELMKSPFLKWLSSSPLEQGENQSITLGFGEKEFSEINKHADPCFDKADIFRAMLVEGFEMYQQGLINEKSLENLKDEEISTYFKFRIPTKLYLEIISNKPAFVSVSKWIAVLILAGGKLRDMLLIH